MSTPPAPRKRASARLSSVSYTFQAAQDLFAEGYAVVPVPHGKKRPVTKDWPNLRLTEAQLKEHFGATSTNIGIILGAASGGLVDIDLDCEEAIEIAEFFLPSTWRKHGRPSSRESHWWYHCSGASTRKFADEGGSIVEIRSTGAQTIVPPSVHPSGERLKWTLARQPAKIDAATLEQRVALIAVTAVLSRHWPAKGSRHNASLAAAGMLLRAGISAQDARKVIALAAAVAGDEEIEDREKSVATTQTKLDADKKIIARKKLAAIIGDAPVERMLRWLDGSSVETASVDTDDTASLDSASPRLRGTALRFQSWLAKLGVSLSYDEFYDRIEIEGLSGSGPLCDDDALIDLRFALEQHSEKLIPKKTLEDLVRQESRRHRHHPVRDLLAECEANWDGEHRVGTWLIDYLDAEDTPYTRAVGRIMLVAAVRRVRSPGCKFDELVVLEGLQGSGKSTLLAKLAMRKEWFTDDLPLFADGKKVIEQTLGKWIIEAGELHGMRKAEVDRLKSTLSRTHDRARLSYDRMTSERGRSWIAIGPTNSSHYLRDQTGNRRFWPVGTGRIKLGKFTKDLVRQLWGEAATLESASAPIRLPRKLYDAAAEIQAARTVDDPFREVLSNFLTGKQNIRIPVDDIWAAVGLSDVARRSGGPSRQVPEAMRSLGFERKQRRLDGKQHYHYVHGDGSRLARLRMVDGKVIGFHVKKKS